MSKLSEDVQALIAELEFVATLLNDTEVDSALDELELQRGTIDTILTKAGRPEPDLMGQHMGRNE